MADLEVGFFHPKMCFSGSGASLFFKRYMGVSKNRGTPKWMVYNGKPY